MATLKDVMETVKVEDHIIHIRVDERYLAGLHPDQEAIEKEAHDALMKRAFDLGQRMAQQREEAVLKMLLDG